MELRVVYVPWAAVSEARAGGVYCRVDDGGAWLTDATPGRWHSSFAGGFLPRSGNERKLVEAALTIEQHSGSMLLDADWVKSQVLVDSEDVGEPAPKGVTVEIEEVGEYPKATYPLEKSFANAPTQLLYFTIEQAQAYGNTKSEPQDYALLGAFLDTLNQYALEEKQETAKAA